VSKAPPLFIVGLKDLSSVDSLGYGLSRKGIIKRGPETVEPEIIGVLSFS
jgi:hypothetical protein